MVRELSEQEQVRMEIDEAGKLYNGHFIFFTNTEDMNVDTGDIYAIPRVISDTKKEYFDSGLDEKYFSKTEYGITFGCIQFMKDENIPPILAF